MPWTGYGILAVFALFVLLMLINPKLSCFGRKISSPLYPLIRKRKQKRVKTEDYGFHLVDSADKEKKAKDFAQEGGSPFITEERAKPSKVIKTHDYGFNLVDKKDKEGPDETGDGKKRKDG